MSCKETLFFEHRRSIAGILCSAHYYWERMLLAFKVPEGIQEIRPR